MDMATLTNAPRTVEVGGRPYLVSALTMGEWGRFQAWIKDFVPKPDPPEDADSVLTALHNRAWPPAIGSKLWWEALDHPGCWPSFVRTVLGNHQAVSDEESLVLAMMAVEDGLVGTLVILSMGGDPSAPSIPSEDEPPPERPEPDDPGPMVFGLAKKFGWTHNDVIGLTFAQIRYYSHNGTPPKIGSKTYRSTADSRAAR